MIEGYIFLHLILLFLRWVVEFGGFWFCRKDSISPVVPIRIEYIGRYGDMCSLGGASISRCFSIGVMLACVKGVISSLNRC